MYIDRDMGRPGTHGAMFRQLQAQALNSKGRGSSAFDAMQAQAGHGLASARGAALPSYCAPAVAQVNQTPWAAAWSSGKDRAARTPWISPDLVCIAETMANRPWVRHCHAAEQRESCAMVGT